MVFTRGAGFQPIVWAGQRTYSAEALQEAPHLAPIRFDEGALPGLETSLLLSPQHRVLHCSAVAQLYFGAPEVLLPAKGLVNGATIRAVIPADGITYVHIMCASHQIVQVGGLWAETLLPGGEALEAMTDAQRAEIAEIFPDAPLMTPARPMLSSREARALCA